MVVADSGARDCWLSGGPQSVGLLNEAGEAVPGRQRPQAARPATAVRLRQGVALPTFGAPPAQGSAWFSVAWSNWCSAESPDVSSLLIVLPSGGSIAAPLDPTLPTWAAGPPAPRCSEPGSVATVSYGQFQAATA